MKEKAELRASKAKLNAALTAMEGLYIYPTGPHLMDCIDRFVTAKINVAAAQRRRKRKARR